MIGLIRDQRGASAVEFALVLPLLLVFLFGIIDGGRLMWSWNQAEKATQVGARIAIVTNTLAPGLATANYVGTNQGGTVLTQGDVIPVSALGEITCTSASCTCTANPCPAPGAIDTAAFNVIVDRMRFMKPDINAANVRVIYRGSGLGYAGDPNGMQIQPLVTVELTGLQFRPLTILTLATITLPDFRTTLTGEDLSGVTFN